MRTEIKVGMFIGKISTASSIPPLCAPVADSLRFSPAGI